MSEDERLTTTENALKQVREFNMQFLEARKDDQQSQVIDKAHDKTTTFKTLKNEISTDLFAINKSIETLGAKIKVNLKGQDNAAGLLTHNESDYLKCLELKKEQLEELLM